jgi:hypothetical protein
MAIYKGWAGASQAISASGTLRGISCEEASNEVAAFFEERVRYAQQCEIAGLPQNCTIVEAIAIR